MSESLRVPLAGHQLAFLLQLRQDADRAAERYQVALTALAAGSDAPEGSAAVLDEAAGAILLTLPGGTDGNQG